MEWGASMTESGLRWADSTELAYRQTLQVFAKRKLERLCMEQVHSFKEWGFSVTEWVHSVREWGASVTE